MDFLSSKNVRRYSRWAVLPGIKVNLYRYPNSVSIETWQLETSWWPRAGWSRSATSDWRGTSSMTPTTLWEEMYVQILFMHNSWAGEHLGHPWPLCIRCVCPWSGWPQRARFREYTPWRVTSGLTGFSSGRSSPSVAYAALDKATKQNKSGTVNNTSCVRLQVWLHTLE